jgi:hypothetical protein
LKVDHYGEEEYTHRALGPAALQWILKRGINLASLRPSFSDLNVAVIHDMHFISYDIGEEEQQSMRDAVASLVLNDRVNKLESIALNNLEDYLEDSDLAAILSKCYGSVKAIDIQDCGLTDSSATHIKRCTKLEAYTPCGNESAAEMVEIFQSCRKLRKVNFGSYEDVDVTDEVLHSLAAHCPLLEFFRLPDYETVSDAAILRVAQSCPLLRTFKITNTNIMDSTVLLLCKHCPLLKELYLSCCSNLTDAAILVVAERLPGLTRVGVSGGTAITSSAIETLTSRCHELELIDLKCCPNVNDTTLSKLAEHCPRLETLDVYGCPVTVAGLIEIATKCTKLNKVFSRFGGDHAIVSTSPLQGLQRFPHVSWKWPP